VTRAPEPRPEAGAEEGPGGLRGLVRDLLALDRLSLAIGIAVPICLTLLEYYGMPWHYTRQPAYGHRSPHVSVIDDRGAAREPPFADLVPGVALPGPEELRPYLWWGLAVLVTMVLLPMGIARVFGAGPRQLGVRLQGTARDAPTYLVLFLLFFPVVWLVSRTPDFLSTYPFYPRRAQSLGWDFVAFEAVYCFQFFAVEFFFRGFIVLGLKPKIGRLSVLVMLAPYCMIHYYKPFPEAMGAIGAGLVLGTLSWRTGTVIYGWFLHYAVALGMDLLSLGQKGLI
jgi:hypothetical protein